MERAAFILETKGLIYDEGIVSIQSIMHATGMRPNPYMAHNAAHNAARNTGVLSKLIDRGGTGPMTYFDPEPIAVHGPPHQIPKATYGAINEATLALEEEIGESGYDSHSLHSSLALLMNGAHAAKAFRGVPYSLGEGEVAVLESVGRAGYPQENSWSSWLVGGSVPPIRRRITPQPQEPLSPHVPLAVVTVDPTPQAVSSYLEA